MNFVIFTVNLILTVIISMIVQYFMVKRALKGKISQAMGIIGKLGNQEVIEQNEKEEVDEAIKSMAEGAMNRNPQLGMGLALLDEFAPEFKEKIFEKPQLLGYALNHPLVKGLLQNWGSLGTPNQTRKTNESPILANTKGRYGRPKGSQ